VLKTRVAQTIQRGLHGSGPWLSGSDSLRLCSKRKDRFKDLMKRIPLQVITTRAALVGAASFGLETYMYESGMAA
jgi:hypothetical protein